MSGKSAFQVAVVAREKWNKSEIEVKEGIGLRIRTAPRSEWVDWIIKCGPRGYEAWWLKPYTWLRRVPDAPWFALICCIGDDLSTAFMVGDGVDCYIPPKDGNLFFFANDAPFAYWNNRGQIIVEVEQTNCKLASK